jgi:hypothetical protein
VPGVGSGVFLLGAGVIGGFSSLSAFSQIYQRFSGFFGCFRNLSAIIESYRRFDKNRGVTVTQSKNPPERKHILMDFLLFKMNLLGAVQE